MREKYTYRVREIERKRETKTRLPDKEETYAAGP
jgi:hypothetical protein